MTMLAVTGTCLPQEVPGLAYTEIFRTAPRARVKGTAPDPPLPLAQGSNRRYDTLLDYNYDYFVDEMVDDSDAEDVSDDVIVTLERPQSPEPLLSTDVSDYVIVSLDTLGQPDPPGAPTMDDPRNIKKIPIPSSSPTPQRSGSSPRPSFLATVERPPLATAEFWPLNTAEQLNVDERSPLDTVKISPHDMAEQLLDTVELLPPDTAGQLSTQRSQESTVYALAVSAPGSTNVAAGDGPRYHTQRTLGSSASVLRQKLPYDIALVAAQYSAASYPSGAYPIENFPTGSHPVDIYRSGDHPAGDPPIQLSPSGTYPMVDPSVESGYYYPLGGSAAEAQGGENRIEKAGIRRGNRMENLSRTALIGEHPGEYSLTASGRQYRSENFPSASHQFRSLNPTYHTSVVAQPLTVYASPQLADGRDEPRAVRMTHDKGSTSRLMSARTSAKALISNRRRSLQRRPLAPSRDEGRSTDRLYYRRLPTGVDARNLDEILYYTGLQREIERSDVLMDAIKDVRTRNGKSIKSTKRRPTTTTLTPVPDMKEVRNKFGSHPLYNSLPQPPSPKINPKPIYQTDVYDNDPHEYLYLPVRAESLEPKVNHEVKGNFEPLAPELTYDSHSFLRHSAYQDQEVTTYRPRHTSVNNKYFKPLISLTSKAQYKSPVIPRGKANHKSSPLTPSRYVSPGTHHQGSPADSLPRRPRTHNSATFKRSTVPNPGSDILSNSRNYNPNSSRGHSSAISGNDGHSSYRTQRPSTYILSSSRHHSSPSTRIYDSPSTKNHRPSIIRSYNSPSTKYHRPSSPRSYDISNTRSYDSPSTRSSKNHRLSHHDSPSSRLQRQSLTRPHGVMESKDQSSSGREPIERPKRGHARHPTISLYEDSKLPRPDPEEKVRQKRGPDMETLLHAHVKFPKYGYDIDPYFGNFPTFGFFDYDPSKET